MHRHEVLIAGAVDEWEIAAGLEAQGVTDGAARRLRHRDVFGLAEELYARVPRAGRTAEAAEGPRERAALPPRTVALHLAPGAVCAVAAGAAGTVRLPLVGALLAVLVAVATWAALRSGPLRAARGGGAAVWTYGLLAYALCGPQAVTALRGDGSFDATAGTAAFTALTLSLLPAAYCARWLAVSSRAQLAPSHGLSDFADAVRPRLIVALTVYATALFVLLRTAAAVAGPSPVAAPFTLGLLLCTARLLAVHGYAARAVAGLATACAVESLTLAAALLHLGPGGAAATAVACAACAAAALALAAQALHVLPRASAHRLPPRRN
ncbi:hypothetical protein AB0M29_32880 [Streptomyces sp. NPDC051976]|uniref:hypothetical protein n=1 Tax=Streptomyces sp. NPDC051976 TaxID=3154947 RepID=UPI0034272D44